MDNRLIKQLVKSRKYKYKTLKSDILKPRSQLERSYQPITKSLKQLIATIEPLIPKAEAPEREASGMVDVTPKLKYRKKSFTPKHHPNKGDGERVINDKTFRESIPSTTCTETLYKTEGDESFLFWRISYTTFH